MASKRATREELESLRKHFQDRFHEWQSLGTDLKSYFIDFFDFKTRLSLKFCSKTEKELVEQSRMHISVIKISDVFPKFPNFTTVTVKIASGAENRYQTHFKERREESHVVTRNGARVSGEKSCHELGVELFEDVLEKCGYGVKDVTVNLDTIEYPMAKSRIKYLRNARKVYIRTRTDEELHFWLEKVPEQLDQLIMPFRHLPFKTEHFEMPHLRNAKTLVCYGRADVTDAQLLELRATHLLLSGTLPLLTRHGVNRYLRRWQCGDDVTVDFRRLELIGIRSDGSDGEGVLLEGVNARKVGLELRVDFMETRVVTRSSPRDSRILERLLMHFDSSRIEIRKIDD